MYYPAENGHPRYGRIPKKLIFKYRGAVVIMNLIVDTEQCLCEIETTQMDLGRVVMALLGDRDVRRMLNNNETIVLKLGRDVKLKFDFKDLVKKLDIDGERNVKKLRYMAGVRYLKNR